VTGTIFIETRSTIPIHATLKPAVLDGDLAGLAEHLVAIDGAHDERVDPAQHRRRRGSGD
jgi:hypothetical protein